jgi:hypothetical protein
MLTKILYPVDNSSTIDIPVLLQVIFTVVHTIEFQY